jgi:DNA-binding NarL/FixJ family response regulator
MMPAKILNTKGAATFLGVSINWIHKLVEMGRLKAYTYTPGGELAERSEETKRAGSALFFYESDLKKYRGPKDRPARGHRYGEQERQEVLRMHATGMSNREIARQTGVSFQTVNNWVNQEQAGEAVA